MALKNVVTAHTVASAWDLKTCKKKSHIELSAKFKKQDSLA